MGVRLTSTFSEMDLGVIEQGPIVDMIQEICTETCVSPQDPDRFAPLVGNYIATLLQFDQQYGSGLDGASSLAAEMMGIRAKDLLVVQGYRRKLRYIWRMVSNYMDSRKRGLIAKRSAEEEGRSGTSQQQSGGPAEGARHPGHDADGGGYWTGYC